MHALSSCVIQSAGAVVVQLGGSDMCNLAARCCNLAASGGRHMLELIYEDPAIIVQRLKNGWPYPFRAPRDIL